MLFSAALLAWRTIWVPNTWKICLLTLFPLEVHTQYVCINSEMSLETNSSDQESDADSGSKIARVTDLPQKRGCQCFLFQNKIFKYIYSIKLISTD